jgi:hypothetical protein
LATGSFRCPMRYSLAASKGYSFSQTRHTSTFLFPFFLGSRSEPHSSQKDITIPAYFVEYFFGILFFQGILSIRTFRRILAGNRQ